MEIERVMTQNEVCEILGISPITLWRERKAGRISFRRIASKIVFTSQDVNEYLERNTRSATAGAGGSGACR